MSKFSKEMDAHRARAKMIHEAIRAYEDSCRAEYGSPYAAMAGALASTLTVLAADRLDSTEDVVRTLKSLTKTK